MNAPVRSVEPVRSSEARMDALAEALFRPMGQDGVYGRTGLYEDVVERLAAFITREREPGTEVVRFPPVMTRGMIERSGYLKSFPNLLGCVCGLHGSEADIRSAVGRFEAGGAWTTSVSPSALVLTPAACYPVYPIAASRGALPRGGLRFDVAADCFRREPSRELDRLQSFRMREYVCIGTPDDVTDFRERWITRARGMADELGLTHTVDHASDPFFGRVGQIKAVSQLQQSLKFELLVPVRPDEKPTACMSFNNHRDHFGQVWDMRDADGNLAHTGCVAFGMDRLSIALFATHGLDPALAGLGPGRARFSLTGIGRIGRIPYGSSAHIGTHRQRRQNASGRAFRIPTRHQRSFDARSCCDAVWYRTLWGYAARTQRRCEERSDEATEGPHTSALGCFASLAMTARASEQDRERDRANRHSATNPPPSP